MAQKCIYFKDEICESLVINDKQCNNCLIKRQAPLLADILNRLGKIEKLLNKPVRKSTVKKAK